MGRYVLRRLLQFIPVLVGTMFLIHYMTALGIQVTGNPITALFGPKQPPPEVIHALSKKYHLADPCFKQTGNPCFNVFVARLGDYIHGDFGSNFRDQSVIDLLSRRWPITARLTVIAIVFESVFGILFGVLAGIRKDKFADNTMRIITPLLIAIPVFVLGVLVQLFIGVYVGVWIGGKPWIPDWVHSIFTVTYRGDAPWLSLIVPGMVLGALSLASIARLTRTGLVENLSSDYVRTAQSKGLQRRRVIGVHALRNSLIPVATYIGADFGFLISGAIVTEGIFNIPGVGGLAYQSALGGEVPVIVAIVTILVLIFLTFNLLVDIVYAVLDPRIRYD
ncbi:MAG TPA: ABC transporter permease [Segeticoccus sp.]|uniref:ABC transporter permease n=1 Tax=Segeticoccus sp. TaxID=2706531 RepID=UPI002D7E4F1A|nr:ABC transporter permease [Segeticoccus sp.]HET8601829.1 ABC transporter permease [Segeticoccus sp.]